MDADVELRRVGHDDARVALGSDADLTQVSDRRLHPKGTGTVLGDSYA
jgi:hypothetical protein